MRGWWLILLVLITGWLQTSFLAAWRPLAVVPDLVIVTVVWSSWRLSATEALGLAAGLGLWLDLASGTDFGLRTAFLTTLVLALLVIRQLGADVEAWGLGLASVAAATIIYNLFILAPLVIGHATISWVTALSLVAKAAVLNVLLAALLRPVFYRLWPETGGLRMGQRNRYV